jgi:hypothetical protein
MDDLFSILIYIIVIISFLASLFKKKPPEGPPQQQRRVPQDRIPGQAETIEPVYEKDQEEYDILREIENMFKQGPEQQQVKLPEPQRKTTMIEDAAERAARKIPSEKVSYEDFVAGNVEPVRDYSERKVMKSEHQYSSFKRKPVKVDKNIEEQAKRFEELLARRSSKQEIARNEILKRIKNPSTFREYILVAEILAKPKALRR